MHADERRSLVNEVGFWWHCIDVGDGVVTPGQKSAAYLRNEHACLHLPDLRGKTVLDIGAWDGYHSFQCEQEGAAEVLAMDHGMWCMDTEALMMHRQSAKARGAAWDVSACSDELWQPDTLPGKKGFDLVHRLLGSRVQSRVADFTTVEAEDLGQHDIVLFLGVLYHLEDPLAALRKLHSLTRELAIIETSCFAIPAYGKHPMWIFHEGDSLGGDPSNFWSPSEAGLHAACREAGFRKALTVGWPDARTPLRASVRWCLDMLRTLWNPQVSYYRAVVHAWK